MRIFTLLAFIALFSSCTQKKTLIIDNPTRKPIEVKFEEGLERTVAAKGQERIVITQASTTVYLNDDIPFTGYVRKDNSLLITKVWEYGVDNDLPSTKKKDQTPSIKRKIYREIDFERLYHSNILPAYA